MLKMKRLNGAGHEVECLIVVENIDGITEIETKDIPLYDACGNQVGLQETDSIYEVYFNNGKQIRITKEAYGKLVEKLKIETL